MKIGNGWWFGTLLSVSASAVAAQTPAEFAEALERSEAISPCVPSAEHLQQGTIHAIHTWSADEVYAVEIGDDLRAVHLIIRHGRTREFALELPDGLEVLGVQLTGSVPAIITGLQDNTLVYRHGFAPDGTESFERCATDDSLANAVYRAVRNFSASRHDVNALEAALTRYMGSGLDSMSLSSMWTDYNYLSQDDILATRTARQIGAVMLEYLSFPAPPVANTQPLSPPSGLSSTEFFNWLVESGAAEPASEEAQDFICAYESALVFAEGIDATHRGAWRCSLHFEPWNDRLDRILVLVRPISVGTYRCPTGWQEFRLFATEGAPVIGEILNCGAAVGQF